MKVNHSPTLLKVFIAAFSAMVIILAAFGVGLTIGAAQTQRGANATALLVEPVCEVQPATRAVEMTLPGQDSAEEAALAPVATATPAPTETVAPTVAPTLPTHATGEAADSPLDLNFFNEAWRLLKEQYYGDLPAGEEITYAAIKGVVEALGDKHTSFMDPQQAEMFRQDMEGEFEGIGARVSAADEGGVKIEYLFPEQPAEKSGVKIGDVVIAVDGKDVTGMDLNAAISLIRGPRNTKVALTIRREGAEKPVEITVTRARIEIKTVETKTLSDGKIEYIALAEFSTPSTNRMAEALKAAVNKKPQGIILDLRGNPGGLLDASIRISSFFIPEGKIVIERFADGKETVYDRVGRYLLNDIPLVVLVDGGSASASEIVAGAIQDAGVGVLIGEKTYGKGSVQLPNTMSDGSQLKITVARWYTPNDRTIDGSGLEPDIVVPLTQEDLDADRDPQLDRALEYLMTGK